MKTLLSFTFLFLLLCAPFASAQKQYTVDGKQYTLKTEVEGTLTLLWNTINDEYRYFSKKGNEIIELKNTRVDGKYQEEFIQTLQLQTSDITIDVTKINFTLASLRNFFNDYNKRKDPNYTYENKVIQIRTRLGIFAGISNNIYTENPDNTILPVAGVDFEIIEESHLKRHSLVIQFKQTFENSDYKFSSSQVSLNYRFKFVNTKALDVFINTDFAAYTHVSRDVLVTDPITNTTSVINISGGNFKSPVTFGLGADYALGNGFITFSYNDIVGLGIDNNGEFPVDFTLGYKLNL